MENLIGGDLGARLIAFADLAATEEAAAARARQHWLRRAAIEDGSLRGVLLDLSERAVVATVQVVSGRRHRGAVSVVGDDFCTVTTESGSEVVVAVDAIAWVRSHDPTPAAGDRTADLPLTFAGAIAALADERPRVSIGFRGGGDVVAGHLVDVGLDVVALRAGDHAGPSTHLSLLAIADVAVVT